MPTPEQEVQDAILAIEIQEPPVNNELPMKRLTKMMFNYTSLGNSRVSSI